MNYHCKLTLFVSITSAKSQIAHGIMLALFQATFHAVTANLWTQNVAPAVFLDIFFQNENWFIKNYIILLTLAGNAFSL